VQELEPPTSTAAKEPPHNPGLYVTYIGSYPGGMQVAGDGTVGAEQRSLGGALVGPKQDVLVSFDFGEQMSYSSDGVIDHNGHIVRSFHSVRYTDGAAVIQLPAGVDANWVTLRSADVNRYFYVTHQPGGRPTGNELLPWEGVYPLTANGSLPDQDALRRRFEDVLRRADYTDPNLSDFGLGHWYAYGKLPDGTEIIAGQYELAFDNIPRTYVLVIAPGKAAQVVFGGVADRSAPLPVQVRLPGHRGWVVVRVGAALSWRPPYAPVTVRPDSAQDAALLPANSTVVEVTSGGREPRQVTLPAA